MTDYATPNFDVHGHEHFVTADAPTRQRQPPDIGATLLALFFFGPPEQRWPTGSRSVAGVSR